MADTSEFKVGPGSPDQPLSAEQIAALIDGRVSDTERASMLKKLGDSDDDIDVIMDAAAAVADLRSSAGTTSDADAGVVRISSRRRQWRTATFISVSVAAAAAAVVMIRSPNARSTSDASNPDELIAALSDKSALPRDWNYTPWSVQRGAGNVADTTAYVRLGARAADLELAIQANDPSARQLAFDLEELLANLPGGSALGSVYRTLGEQPQSSDLRSQARQALRGLPRQDLIEFGAWLETARIASSRGDTSWFNRDESMQMLQNLIEQKKISPANDAWAREILNRNPDWQRASQGLVILLRDQ